MTEIEISAIPKVYTPLRNEIRITGLRDLGIRQCSTSVPTIFWAAKRPKFLGFTVLTRRDFTLERAKIQKFRSRLRRDWYQSTYFARHARKLRRFRAQINMISLWNSSNRHQIVKIFWPPKAAVAQNLASREFGEISLENRGFTIMMYP